MDQKLSKWLEFSKMALYGMAIMLHSKKKKNHLICSVKLPLYQKTLLDKDCMMDDKKSIYSDRSVTIHL